MTTTEPTTWRELADQLTPQQVAEIAYCEREQIPPGLAAPHHLINHARALSKYNLAQAFCAGIETPADAIDAPSVWLELETDLYQRVYRCWERRGAGIEVQVIGEQFSDDRPIERSIFHTNTDKGCDELTPARARILAHFLMEAAEVVDRLSESDAKVTR